MDDESRTSDESDLPEGELEDGLRLAFGGEGARAGESAIQALERLTGVRSRILLPDAEGDESPVVKVRSDADEELGDDPRYQVLGEIARGGVGVVFKSRDRDLGRDVAIKVLRQDLVDVPEVVQRFIEEAQIGGQLQHPGIVPVYGLGIQKDGRPYFAMKLVKGQTLSVLLRESEGRGRLLTTFERICQTVAYAHARRVVHRDLKPSNVLVGAYGEVQVVDWGFAKVLPQGGTADEREPDSPVPDLSVIETIRTKDVGSTSQVGSVMGTPAYMPPEQARGEVEKLDERADVFALGAILCEILTRKPPYTGKGSELVSMAARGALEEAEGRLDACGADPDLVALTKQCLAPAPDARPRHAGELAEGIAAHLASVEERRREAELRAAAARRTRRLTIALAAAVLMAVVLGGGGLWAADRSRRDGRERATAAVNDALKEANLVLGRARTAGIEETEPWDEALAAAEDAVGTAERVGAPAEAVAEADGFHAGVAADRLAAVAAAKQAVRDRELAARLREIELGWAKFYLVGDDKEEGYRAAFAGAGLDPETTEAAALAERIEGSTVRDVLVEALDDWLRVRRTNDGECAKLRALLTRVDPDQFRERVRDLSGTKDADGLRELRDETDQHELPIRSLRHLADALGTVGNPADPAAAVAVLRVARQRDPADLGACAALGTWHLRFGDGKPQEASACLARIVADRPGSPRAHAWLGEAFRRSSLLDAWLAELRQAHRLDERGRVRDGLVAALRHNGVKSFNSMHYREAAALFKEAVELKEDLAVSWIDLAINLARIPGRLKEAERCARRALKLEPDSARFRGILGDICRLRSNWQNALEAWDHPNWTVYRAAVLTRLGRAEEAIRSYRNLAQNPHHIRAISELGPYLHRLGRLDEAIDVLEVLARVQPSSDVYALLSRLHRQRGEPQLAQERMERAIELQRAGAPAPTQKLGFVVGHRHGREEALAWLDAHFPRIAPADRAAFLFGLADSYFWNALDPGEALRCVDEGLRLAPDAPRGHWLRGWFATSQGDPAGALASLRRAFELEETKNKGQSLRWLASGLWAAGRLEEALPLWRRFYDYVVGDERRWNVEVTEKLLALKARLPALLAREVEPAGAHETALYAELCWRSREFPRCVELVERALAHGIDWNDGDAMCDLREEKRLCALAAAMAARAAQGEGENASEHGREERRAFREKALEFLRRQLDAEQRLMPYQDMWNQDNPRRRLADLLLCPYFAPFRDPEGLAKLPPEERKAWEALWRDVKAEFERWRF